jgi:hypothetical protein
MEVAFGKLTCKGDPRHSEQDIDGKRLKSAGCYSFMGELEFFVQVHHPCNIQIRERLLTGLYVLSFEIQTEADRNRFADLSCYWHQKPIVPDFYSTILAHATDSRTFGDGS